MTSPEQAQQRVALTRADADDVLAAAWRRIDRMPELMGALPVMDVGVPEKEHPGKVELICTLYRSHQQVLLNAIQAGLAEQGYLGEVQDDPQLRPAASEPCAMVSILVSGALVDQPAAAGPVRGPAVIPGVAEDVDLALGPAGLVVDNFIRQHRDDLARCTGVDVQGILLRVCLTYLISEGLVTVAPEGAFDRLLPLELEHPHAGDVTAALAEAVERKAKLDRMARSMAAT